MKDFVSIITVVHKEANHLALWLKSLETTNQTVNHEVIIVTTAEDDEIDIVTSACSGDVKIVSCTGRKWSQACEAGIQSASVDADTFFLTHSDVVALSSNLLELILPWIIVDNRALVSAGPTVLKKIGENNIQINHGHAVLISREAWSVLNNKLDHRFNTCSAEILALQLRLTRLGLQCVTSDLLRAGLLAHLSCKSINVQDDNEAILSLMKELSLV